MLPGGYSAKDLFILAGIILLLLRMLIAAALYGFLGWALWLLYRDLRQRSQSLASPPAPPLVLTQLEPVAALEAAPAVLEATGADAAAVPAVPPAPDGTAQPAATLPAVLVFRITATEAILGRDPTCQIYIDHPTISARHARLAYHHAQWWIEDLHSRNGTFLNDQPVQDAVVLTQGDELRCGAHTFAVSLE